MSEKFLSMLNGKHYSIKYSPKLRLLVSCRTSILVIDRLEYWFSKYPNRFFKFIEPCDHKLYKTGDSWSEELGVHRKTFNRLFDQIGIRYKSKSTFLKSSDRFQGKFYASFYDRIEKKTYYVRNHSLFEEASSQASSSKERKHKDLNPLQSGQNVRSNKDININNNIINKQNNTPKIKTLAQKNKISSEENLVESDLIKIWEEWVEEAKKTILLTPCRKKRLDKVFSLHFSRDIAQWKNYCKTIAYNNFLMGKGPRGWKATLDWALDPKNIQKVREGAYTGQREIPLTKEENFDFHNIQGSESWKRVCQNLIERLGLPTFKSWFEDLEISGVEEGKPKLSCSSEFKAQWIKGHFLGVIEEAFKDVIPQVQGIEVGVLH